MALGRAGLCQHLEDPFSDPPSIVLTSYPESTDGVGTKGVLRT